VTVRVADVSVRLTCLFCLWANRVLWQNYDSRKHYSTVGQIQNPNVVRILVTIENFWE